MPATVRTIAIAAVAPLSIPVRRSVGIVHTPRGYAEDLIDTGVR
ncbi:hypothetical protein OH799_17670 [Nocardia sp. NBC_00881]|nr:hypothetical protein OH799_17670 [Nocardia sp. NBC_00881]